MNYSLIKSNYGNSLSINALSKLYDLNIKFKTYDFTRGSDERQYNHPNVNLKLCILCKHGYYKEYHTSKDNFKLVTPKGLEGGFNFALKSLDIMLKNYVPLTTIICEPNLGKRNLYPLVNYEQDKKRTVFNYLNFLAYSDGKNDLVDISNILNLPFYWKHMK